LNARALHRDRLDAISTPETFADNGSFASGGAGAGGWMMGSVKRTVDAVALGRPVALPESVRARIAAERDAGMALQAISNDLNADRVLTARGGRWYPSTVAAVLASIEVDAEAERLARTSATGSRG
jgi:hypothetical protein